MTPIYKFIQHPPVLYTHTVLVVYVMFVSHSLYYLFLFVFMFGYVV